MKRWTTPIIPIRINGIDLKSCTTIWVTIKQGDKEVTKDTPDGVIVSDVNRLLVLLTQEETAIFDEGEAFIDVRLFKDDRAFATKIRRISIEDVLREGLIS